MEKRILISNLPKISAIYFALLQCGYDYYAVEKDAALVEKIEGFRMTQGNFDNPFFSEVKQNTCEVYSYWPRAAALETATFFMDFNMQFKNFDVYRKNIMSASNISDIERNQAFWEWIEGFPTALGSVLGSKEFQAYLNWENGWLEQQNLIRKKDLLHIQKILNICATNYASPIQKVSVILNPIKCAYSADYHMYGSQLLFCSGSFRPESVIHEFLHHIVHPLVKEHKVIILQCHVPYPDIDSSYYLTGGENGTLNAFEEYMVRKLANVVLTGDFPSDLSMFLNGLLHGIS